MPASKLSIPAATLSAIRTPVRRANQKFNRAFSGDSAARQPVHTVYGGAHLYRYDSARKLGDVALKTLETYAPDAGDFARALNLHDDTGLYRTVYQRVVEKLRREPVEDQRIDFEDGYGVRPDAEEDGHAISVAEELAKAHREKMLPPFIGIRIKSFTEELFARSTRTLDLFVSTLLRATKREVPSNFVVTLPKVTVPEQVTALAKLLGALEKQHKVKPGTLKLEIMVETPQAILDQRGVVPLPALVRAGQGRCVAAHFGTYDYTAGLNITAAHQTMTHPAADFAKHVMQVSLAQSGVAIADGATNVLPIGPNRAAPGETLSHEQIQENAEVISAAWRTAYRHIRHALVGGFYQGWDLHPAQLPIRYAATYAFFLEGLGPASARLKSFISRAAQATRVGEVFDDAATGQGLLNFFLRGIACGALTQDEARMAGLTIEELRTRSFMKILDGRRASTSSA